MRGLPNYCLSCCVNTLLQTLSATYELRDLLDKWDTAGIRTDSHNVPMQLKKVLAVMRSDNPQPAPHHDFLHCLDRNCIRLYVQHDADEVFLSILNFIQEQMDDRDLAFKIQNLYKISLETCLQCLECSSVQTHPNYLLSLPLHITEDQNTLEGCLTSFFEYQELRGANSCFCPQCETKTPSKRGVRLVSLPQILCVHLKRFRNNRGYARKLDSLVTFPETFDSEILNDVLSTASTQNHCKYTLHAVVVHSGSAMCGHYTAYVRHQRWYYANDSHVKEVSWDDVKQTYGKHGDTAYMLMYRRGPKEEQRQPEVSG